LELRRLDRLLNAIWHKAIAGDLQAIDRFIKISERRGKIDGWDSLTIKGDTAHPVALTMNSRPPVDAEPDDDQLREVVSILVEAGALPAEALAAFVAVTSGTETDADDGHAPATGR